MNAESPTRGRLAASRWRRRALVAAVMLLVAAAAAVTGIGWVPNRQWNRTREESVRTFRAPDARAGYTVCTVELDDQGVLWDRRQLRWTLDHLRSRITEHERGVIVFVLVPGWKADARWREGGGRGLPDFRRSLERLAARAARASGGSELPGVVGVYVGWRGSSFDLPLLENLTFWNRRVAAHRAASTELQEVVQLLEHVVGADPASKLVVVGHSMGGLIVEKTLFSSLVTASFLAGERRQPLPLGLDLVVSVNPAVSALDADRMVAFLERRRVRLVNRFQDGTTAAARGPLIASVNSRVDVVNRVVFPIGMWLNGLLLRYRSDHEPGRPSQRTLGRRAAGHEPSLVSHEALVEGGRVELRRLPGVRPATPYWLIQVPPEISPGHSEVDGPLFSRLLFELMDRNRVFDPEVELCLVAEPTGG